MLVVDIDGERHLLHAVEHHRGSDSDVRCLWLARSEYEAFLKMPLDAISLAAGHYVHDPDAALYVCEDGDIYLFSVGLRYEQAKKITQTLGKALELDLDPIMHVFELKYQWMALAAALEERINAILSRQNAEIIRKTREEKRKLRDHILGYDIPAAAILALPELRLEHKKPVVMVVEDDRFMRSLVEATLSGDYTVKFAKDAGEAVHFYAEIAPDILFLDINLPDMSGLEIIDKIRQLDPQAYIVMLSGHQDKEHISEATRLGAKGFIGKPFTKAKLEQYMAQSPHMQRYKRAA